MANIKSFLEDILPELGDWGRWRKAKERGQRSFRHREGGNEMSIEGSVGNEGRSGINGRLTWLTKK